MKNLSIYLGKRIWCNVQLINLRVLLFLFCKKSGLVCIQFSVIVRIRENWKLDCRSFDQRFWGAWWVRWNTIFRGLKWPGPNHRIASLLPSFLKSKILSQTRRTWWIFTSRWPTKGNIRSLIVVGRIMAHEDVHFLTPWACEYVNFYKVFMQMWLS